VRLRTPWRVILQVHKNRRGLWTDGAGVDGVHKHYVQWNGRLLDWALPMLYAHVLEAHVGLQVRSDPGNTIRHHPGNIRHHPGNICHNLGNTIGHHPGNIRALEPAAAGLGPAAALRTRS
jgi:hypothetical protein